MSVASLAGFLSVRRAAIDGIADDERGARLGGNARVNSKHRGNNKDNNAQ